MYLLFKRIFDVLVSFSILILLLPFLIPIVIILKFTRERKIFFTQERIGLNNKTFKMIKFTTMIKDSMNKGAGRLTIKNDSRVTVVGKFLRKTKINELPQLINVIKGEMSIVGPRPLIKPTFDDYPSYIKTKINNVKPGITGIGSIVFIDEASILSNKKKEDAAKIYKEKIAPLKGELEIWYQNNRSFILDIKLIIITIWVIIFPKSKILEKCFDDLPKIEL